MGEKSDWAKAPGATLDFTIDWATDSWLETGETISTHDWSVPAGLTEESASESEGRCTIWLSGGVAGTLYTVTCTITTSLGRTDTRCLYITVRNR